MLTGSCRNAVWAVFGLWRESCALVCDVKPPGLASQHCPELSLLMAVFLCAEELFLPRWKPQAHLDLVGLSFR